MNCIICGRQTLSTKIYKRIEAAFCRYHIPQKNVNSRYSDIKT